MDAYVNLWIPNLRNPSAGRPRVGIQAVFESSGDLLVVVFGGLVWSGLVMVSWSGECGVWSGLNVWSRDVWSGLVWCRLVWYVMLV